MIPGGNENPGVMATGIVLIFEAIAGQVREERKRYEFLCENSHLWRRHMVEQKRTRRTEFRFQLSSALYPALALV